MKNLVEEARTCHGEHTTHGKFIQRLADRIEELESKLARVIGALDAMADAIQYEIGIYDASMDAEAALKSYRTTLAELKGNKDD